MPNQTKSVSTVRLLLIYDRKYTAI